jgi:hypothetical protein
MRQHRSFKLLVPLLVQLALFLPIAMLISMRLGRRRFYSQPKLYNSAGNIQEAPSVQAGGCNELSQEDEKCKDEIS